MPEMPIAKKPVRAINPAHVKRAKELLEEALQRDNQAIAREQVNRRFQEILEQQAQFRPVDFQNVNIAPEPFEVRLREAAPLPRNAWVANNPAAEIDWDQPVYVEKAVEKISMSHTIASVFRLKEVKSNVALFGVEVEVEGANLPAEVLGFSTKADGSLRGESNEYVFRTPANLNKSIDRLTELSHQLEKSKLDMSFRTSVHVHVNMSNFNKTQLCTFLYLAFLMEEPLVRFCGEGRVGNRFCLRAKDAEGKVRELEQLFASDEARLNVKDSNQVKYSAINLASLRRFGTVEFRSMKGTVDVAVLSTWLKALDNIYKAAMHYKSPKEIADELRIIGGKDFASKVFGDVFESFDYSSLHNDVHSSFSLLISLPYEYEMKEAK